jgi:hypothetical protein
MRLFITSYPNAHATLYEPQQTFWRAQELCNKRAGGIPMNFGVPSGECPFSFGELFSVNFDPQLVARGIHANQKLCK